MMVYIVQHEKSKEIFGCFATHRAAIEFIGDWERDRSAMMVKIYPLKATPEPIRQLAEEIRVIKDRLRCGVEL